MECRCESCRRTVTPIMPKWFWKPAAAASWGLLPAMVLGAAMNGPGCAAFVPIILAVVAPLLSVTMEEAFADPLCPECGKAIFRDRMKATS